MPPPTYKARVKSVRDLASEVRELILQPDEALPDYQAGQWTSLHLPVGERPPLVRAYSFATPPLPSGELVLSFDRVPDGLGSQYLYTLEPGDEVVFGRPLGNFVLPEGDGELLWLARFTGVVPFRAMLWELLERPRFRKVTLVYSAERPDCLAYYEEFQRAAEEQPWFELVGLTDAATPGWEGRSGSVLDLLPELAPAPGELTPMVCGTREFVRPIRDYFYGLGFERRAVKWENYD